MAIQFPKINDMTLNCLGDSTTWGDNGIGSGGPQISWTTQIQKILPFKTVRNYGVCGARIANKDDRDDSFIQRFQQMDRNADTITVLGGINDFQHDVPLGEADSQDPFEFYGALNLLVLGLSKIFVGKPIIFMTPMKNNFKHPTKKYPTTLQKNRLGLSQADYVSAIKQVCNFYSLPVIDMYASSGLSPFLTTVVPDYMPDGMHYSELGYQKLAHRIAGELIQYLY